MFSLNIQKLMLQFFCHTLQIIRLVTGMYSRHLSAANNQMAFAIRLEFESELSLHDLGLAT